MDLRDVQAEIDVTRQWIDEAEVEKAELAELDNWDEVSWTDGWIAGLVNKLNTLYTLSGLPRA